jgi:hypothetical protein
MTNHGGDFFMPSTLDQAVGNFYSSLPVMQIICGQSEYKLGALSALAWMCRYKAF